MNVKRSAIRNEPFGVKRDTEPGIVGEELKVSPATECKVQDVGTPDSVVTGKINNVDPSQHFDLTTDLPSDLTTNKRKSLGPESMKLILPYEINITSAKGSFTHKIETQHDVDILLQYLMPMNRTVPTIH